MFANQVLQFIDGASQQSTEALAIRWYDASPFLILTKFSLMMSQKICSDVGLLIKESFLCGYKSGQIWTCCPTDDQELKSDHQSDGCSLQNEKPASCVPYNQCSPFTQMIDNLVKPLSNVVLQCRSYVTRHWAWKCRLHLQDILVFREMFES